MTEILKGWEIITFDAFSFGAVRERILTEKTILSKKMVKSSENSKSTVINQ